MISLAKREDCCGCSACEQACPAHCITLSADEEGFCYPLVNRDACINCCLCEKVCPVKNPEKERRPIRVFAAINVEEQVRQRSSSGGVFTPIAESVLAKGGFVFGVRFDADWNVVFDHATDSSQLQFFRGSKYVQADMRNVFTEIQDCLRRQKPVLYVGTPCQVAGLRKFLGRDYDQLLLVDILCEGVPSPKLWKRYLHEELDRLCKRNSRHGVKLSQENVTITNVSFRNKEKGWKSYAFSLSASQVSKDGNIVRELSPYVGRNSMYLQALIHYLTLRPICYECPFKSSRSHSDITIADYWGIQHQHPEMDDDKGTSMVYLNTEKGVKAFPYGKYRLLETHYEEALCFNNVESSVKKHPSRDLFYAKLDETKSVTSLMKHYTFPLTYILKERAKSIFFFFFPGNTYWLLQKRWKRFVKR